MNSNKMSLIKDQLTDISILIKVCVFFYLSIGSKYDVEVPYDKRYPFLADRLGHPEFVS
jgi:hypothetical protein